MGNDNIIWSALLAAVPAAVAAAWSWWTTQRKEKQTAVTTAESIMRQDLLAERIELKEEIKSLRMYYEEQLSILRQAVDIAESKHAAAQVNIARLETENAILKQDPHV